MTAIILVLAPQLLTSNVCHEADSCGFHVSLIMSGKRTAQEEMNLYQVLLAVQVDISDEGRVCREEDVLPVLWLLWVAESGENSLPVPLQVGVLAIKQTSLQLQAETKQSLSGLQP